MTVQFQYLCTFFLLMAIEKKKKITVLDFGCGSMNVSRKLNKYSFIKQIVGIDIAIVGLLEGSLKQYATTGFSITPYQKYFLFPGTSVPRVKLQNLSIDSGIKTVRDINSADVCFYSDSTLHKLSHT